MALYEGKRAAIDILDSLKGAVTVKIEKSSRFVEIMINNLNKEDRVIYLVQKEFYEKYLINFFE